MDLPNVSEIAKAGMTFEKSRLELASYWLSQANVAYSSKTDALNAADQIMQSAFLKQLGVEQSTQNAKAVKTVYDPTHPQADGNGNVFFIDIDPIGQMATLVSALRAYEANVKAYNISGDMNAAALSIGSNK